MRIEERQLQIIQLLDAWYDEAHEESVDARDEGDEDRAAALRFAESEIVKMKLMAKLALRVYQWQFKGNKQQHVEQLIEDMRVQLK